MSTDVVIEIVNGGFVFSCPFCKGSGVFGIDLIKENFGKAVIKNCPNCSADVTLDSLKIEGTIMLFTAGNPNLKNPLKEEIEKLQSTPSTADPEIEVKMEEGDFILVVDREKKYREEISQIFSSLAKVDAYDGSDGAERFIMDRADSSTLIIMDVFLGNSTFIDVLNGIKDDKRASNIPIIIVYPKKKDKPIIERMTSNYPQIKRIVLKEDLLKKLNEFTKKFMQK